MIMKKLALLFGLLLAFPAFAADNAVIVTPGTGVTMKSKDIGAGVQAMQPVLSDTGGNALSTPTAGADAVSNTSTGLLAYDRLLGFNGTTWDRLQVDANKFLKMTLTSGALIDLGSQADAACGTDNGSCSLIALQKRGNQNLTTVNTTAAAAVPAGTNRIGYVTDDPCNNASAKVYTPINVVTATNVIITGVSAKKKYICGIFLYPGGTDNIAVYQATTGTACATALVSIFGGTTTGTGFITTAQAGFVVGTGSAAFAATTVVNTDICVTTSAAVQLSGVVVTADQ